MKRSILMSVSVSALLVTLTACAPTSTHPQTPNSTQNTHTVSNKDGTIVSKVLVKIPGQNPDINIYKIFYMSQGVKVEEFVSIPTAKGKYPLVVNLHGGYGGPRPDITHVTSYVYDAQSLTNAPATQIILEPEYQGYADSDGHVQDLQSNTKDVENAIATVEGLGQMAPDMYVIGYSLGGGIALKIASERTDVKAVVAVSPFMGNDEEIKWLDSHPQQRTPLEQQERSVIPYWESIWGNYQTNRAGYEGVSIIDHISTIQAPVLLLQGTGDQNVIWQTVQDVADQMKQQNKTVKLVLYPGGQHGLHDQYAEQSTQEITNWFGNYGLPTPGWW